jgi:adenine-specific DNA-methyltransferase
VRLLAIDEMKGDLLSDGYSEPLTHAFITAHPTLVVDTRHFAPNFTCRVLEAIADLDGTSDGLLLHSENFQAIALLQHRYRNKVKCIYIDPPYNSDASAIDYKNGYKTSSWVSLIEGRIALASELLCESGVFVAAIDDEQQRELNFILTDIFNGRLLGTICVRANPSGRPTKTGYSVSHEYLMFAGRTGESAIGRMPPTTEQMARFNQRDEQGLFEWRNLRREGSNSDRSARRGLYYPIYLRGDSIRVPKLAWNQQSEEWTVEEEPLADEQIVWPDNEGGEQKTWRWEWATVMAKQGALSVRKDRSGRDYVYYKRRPNDEGVVSVSSWFDAKYSATEHGTAVLKSLFGRAPFSYPKSIHAVLDSIYIAGASRPKAVVLDFFAGSGTTGHAVISLNRDTPGHRKFILVEIASYFDTVLLPRIKKVTFSPNGSRRQTKTLATPKKPNAARGSSRSSASNPTRTP